MTENAGQRQYDEKFMDYASLSSHYAASEIIPLLLRVLPVASVADIGCAGGSWLSVWRASGVSDVRGVDGDYVNQNALEFPRELFTPADLSRPLDLSRRFDLVQSLEVAEHIDVQFAEQFVHNLATHAEKYLLFSAAVPGQGGEYHVNEQPLDFWRERLTRHGFDAYDFVRPKITSDHRISFWYRYNIVLYVRREHQATLDPMIRATRVPEGVAIADLSPIWFRVRKRVVRVLPVALRDGLARLKAHVAPTGRF
ncbi:methyltransferase domain-containing protein [Bradyrhizobium yuanmingense]|uniref:methyltransferase domain-containing protein n=1 Tax=Bradyrhizobium yuanmingense TaxID=108015 RepID=UPI0023B97A46|nr:methyltransferase domain-containing protein [Bradyrhizobium yuanmingense]MDF0497957.1 methyltransferase domain-containing protein [Bradyrhizobium yuanmingense]